MTRIFVAIAALLAALPAAAATPQSRTVGKYEITLMLPPEGLYAQEEMEVGFRLTEGAAPVRFAKLKGRIDMPSMPGMASFEEISHSHGVPGEYGVHPTFPHGGEYRLRLAFIFPDAGGAEAEFTLPVEDPVRNRPNARFHPFRLDLETTPKPPTAREAADLRLIVRLVNSPDMAAAKAFDIVHEKSMHLFLVRSDLGEFAHEHPEMSSDGTFTLHHTFARGGTYRAFADVAPKGAGSQILSAPLTVAGVEGERFDIRRAAAEPNHLRRQAGPMTVEIVPPQPKLPIKKSFVLETKLTDAKGPVADLQPYLGAMGHLLLIHEDAESFVHCHPTERDPQDTARGIVPFLVRFPKPGFYRGWVQFQRAGTVHTADFALQVSE